MTEEQAALAKTVIFGVTCLAMIGVYVWACRQGTRATKSLQERLLARFRETPPDGETG